MAHKDGLSSQKVMPVMGHVRELQIRLTVAAVVMILAATLAYVFRDQLIHLLLSPLDGQQLIYLNPAGGFSFILLVSVYTGLAFAAPIAIHQAYSFIRPILSSKSRKNSFFIFVSSLILLVAGVTFGYIFAIPGALNFLHTFAGDYVEASLTADSYLNFIVAYTLGIGLIFQLPLILMIIHWIKPLTPSGLMKSQKWIIVLAFVAAAIITPTPDPMNQTIIALPIILVYQLGVTAVLISIFREKRRSKKSQRVQTTVKHADVQPLSTAPRVPASSLAKQPTVNYTTSVKKPVAHVARQNKPAEPIPAATKPRRTRSIDGFSITKARTGAPKHVKVPAARPTLARQVSQSPAYPHRSVAHYRTSSLSLDGISRAVQ